MWYDGDAEIHPEAQGCGMVGMRRSCGSRGWYGGDAGDAQALRLTGVV